MRRCLRRRGVGWGRETLRGLRVTPRGGDDSAPSGGACLIGPAAEGWDVMQVVQLAAGEPSLEGGLCVLTLPRLRIPRAVEYRVDHDAGWHRLEEDRVREAPQQRAAHVPVDELVGFLPTRDRDEASIEGPEELVAEPSPLPRVPEVSLRKSSSASGVSHSGFTSAAQVCLAPRPTTERPPNCAHALGAAAPPPFAVQA
jgi:hypothetical protein